MSIVTLQFGQCGNQIGDSLYSTITEDIQIKDTSKNIYNCLAINKWFDINKHGVWEPRSVIIDTESKVVDSIRFKFKNIIAKSSGGSANNWAYGYMEKSKILKNEVSNMVRSEVEKCDYLSSFLNLYSSSGGTGSGVGSFIIELLRDDYPNKNIVNAIVLPYVKGEIVTQSYNSLLTLSHLYSLADSTIIFENERLHYSCKHTLNIQDVNFSNINTIIAQQLAALYQPINNIDSISFLNQLTSHQSYKYIQGSRSWKTLLASVSKQSRFDFIHQKNVKIKTISTALITRGSGSLTESDIKPFKEANVYVPWLTVTNSFNVYHQTRKFLNFDKYLTVVSNNNSVCIPLNFVLEDAWNMFTHGAYLHHYRKYDVDEEFFLNSFQVLENILDHYGMSAWTVEDKGRLLVLLQQHGASNLDLIQKNMPHKSLPEIRYMCDKHTKLALNEWCCAESKKFRKDETVKSWLHVLKQVNSSRKGSVQDIVSRVLKYIALFEKRRNTTHIDLRDCYLVLSDISNGVAAKKLDESTNYFLFECLTKLAEALKEGETGSYKSHLRSLRNIYDILKSNEDNNTSVSIVHLLFYKNC
ncbi:hypothetical protein NQ314_019969 [Rhamnusium bicolor]|uniref:Tubulin delta chain n=1 Tax=Rhamnusium bicolor TaxID=1586634 RepID=A0AAV8WLD5_9CUCU|nr:hypothetical protein NQ314_019969 [Rhamnusium bicolor]